MQPINDLPLIQKVFVNGSQASVMIRVVHFEQGLTNSVIEAIDDHGRRMGSGYIKSVDVSNMGQPCAKLRISIEGIVYQGNYDFNSECAVELDRVTIFKDFY